jgi:hypothetical protein
MYVLIVMSWIWGYNGGGPVTTFQEFQTQQKCEAAANKLSDWGNTHQRGGKDTTIVWCVEK